MGYLNGELRFWLGWAQELAGDQVGAEESWRQARNEMERFSKEQPENYLLLGYLAMINIGLHDKASAFALVDRAISANPALNDALTGGTPIEILARVAALAGEPERAFPALQKLASMPYQGPVAAGVPITPALLRLDPCSIRFGAIPASKKLLPHLDQNNSRAATHHRCTATAYRAYVNARLNSIEESPPVGGIPIPAT